MSEWIKCSDDMPAIGSSVLVCDSDGLCWLADYDGDEFSPDWGPEANIEATHWMQLPEPPDSY